MIIDPIGDLLTRIRNGYQARLSEIHVPFSKLKSRLVEILKKNGYIATYDIDKSSRDIRVSLNDIRTTKYMPSFRRISTPGQRIYLKASEIKKSRNGVGIYIISTPKGIITGYEAHALNVGGELLCEVF
jgi:small subunit ribosomal protein S8